MKHADSAFDKMHLKGKWWLPVNPKHIVDGELIGSDAEGYRLTVSGSFNPNESVRSYLLDDAPSFSVIHGHTRHGSVTLCEAFRTRASGTSSGLFESELYVKIVVQGVLLASSDDLRFKALRCKLSMLCDWLDTRAFHHDLKDDLRHSTIELKLPGRLTVHKGDGFVVHLEHAVSGPEYRIGQNSLIVEWEPEFVVESRGPELSWEHPTESNYSSIVYALSQFLAVAAMSPSYEFDVRGYSGQFKEEVSRGKKYKIPISLHREQRLESSHYDFRQELFSWKVIAGNPQKYFRNWFQLFDGLAAPISLFVDSISRKNSYSPERFFNLMSALEGLHRYKNPHASRPTPGHAQRVQSIIERVHDTDRLWLDEKLKYSYEPSLRRRMKDLVEPFAGLFGWLVGASGSPRQQKEWCKKVIGAMADARNCIAHNLPEAGPDPGQRHYHFTRIAETLMAIWLMKEIGISDETIHSRIKENFRMTQYRERLIKFLKAASELLPVPKVDALGE